MIQGYFNHDLFYRQGFTSTFIEKNVADQLLQTMKAQSYVHEDDVYSLDNQASVALSKSWNGVVHPRCPDWDKKSPFNSPPSVFKDFWFEAARGPYFKFFTDVWGDFSQQTVMAHRYLRGDGMGWHYDVTDTTWLLNLIYLTDQEFLHEDGGYLGIGRCKITNEGIPMPETVETQAEFVPMHGLLVTIDNTNPKILHRVQKMVTEKERFVLVGQLGYIENTLNKEKRKHYAEASVQP